MTAAEMRALVAEVLLELVPRSRALTLDEVCERLGMSKRTAEEKLEAGSFCIPALPREDYGREGSKKPLLRFSSVDVDRYLERAATERRHLKIAGSRRR